VAPIELWSVLIATVSLVQFPRTHCVSDAVPHLRDTGSPEDLEGTKLGWLEQQLMYP
jgi:hypothetical protein